METHNFICFFALAVFFITFTLHTHAHARAHALNTVIRLFYVQHYLINKHRIIIFKTLICSEGMPLTTVRVYLVWYHYQCTLAQLHAFVLFRFYRNNYKHLADKRRSIVLIS